MLVEAYGGTDALVTGMTGTAQNHFANAGRARTSAASLLGEDSGNYSLYAALGWLLSLAGQHKVKAPLGQPQLHVCLALNKIAGGFQIPEIRWLSSWRAVASLGSVVEHMDKRL